MNYSTSRLPRALISLTRLVDWRHTLSTLAFSITPLLSESCDTYLVLGHTASLTRQSKVVRTFFTRYADAAYANVDDFRSTTGYVSLAGEGTITWRSKKQI